MVNLSELMEAASAAGMAAARDRELHIPILTLHMGANEGPIVLPIVGRGASVSARIRAATGVFKPVAATLVVEGWSTSLNRGSWQTMTERERAWFARLRRGDIGVKDLPEDLRGDILIIMGETAEGECADRAYTITPHPFRKDRRQFEARVGDFSFMITHFRPMFPADDERDKTDGRIAWAEYEQRREDMWRDIAEGQS